MRSPMSRRDLLRVAGVGVASLARPASVGAIQARRNRPNVVLIMADDLGYGDLGCYGNGKIATPNLDALAKAGLRFTDFHSNGAVCSPTRAALLTGRYQQRCGVEGVITAKRHRHAGMPLEEQTFAEVLKTAGYITGLFGKWHLGYRVDFNPTRQGFDEFIGYVSGNVDYHSHIDQTGVEDWWRNCKKTPESGYSTDLIGDHGVSFIERHKDRPFCLYLAHEAPHYPYQGRKDKADRSPGQPEPIRGSRKDIAGAYREMVEAMDEGVGRIVQTVKRLGLSRRTLLFVCSDNGAVRPGSNGPLAGWKGSLWEGGHRVPAIACWPGKIKPGGVTHETAMTMDLLPTLADAAGAAIPPGTKPDGVSLLPLLLRGERPPERTLFWRFGNQKAVRKGPWKLLVNPREPKRKRQERGSVLRLHHLGNDLGERKDLSADQPARVEALQAELADWEKSVSAGVTRRT